MVMTKFWVKLGLGLIYNLVLFGAANAQTANLSGVVIDNNGSVIPGVQITVLNKDTANRRDAETSNEGTFAVPILPPGKYSLTAKRDGFSPVLLDNIILNVSDERSVRIQLKVGDVKEQVIVTADPPLMDDSAAVGTVVNRKFVENLPLNGRSFQSLIALTPGIVMTPVTGGTEPGQFSVNGQRTNTNNFMVDGVSANFGIGSLSSTGQTLNGSTPGLTAAGGTNGLVSVDAMQEFKVQTSTYAPEFGRSPGAQISIVTRSGTNQYHGNAFDYVRNDKFDARNFFNKVPAAKPPLRQNDFGGTFGGPIIKNKTFFFFSYEGLRLRQPVTATGNFLTAAARANVAAVWKPIVNAEPIPTGPVNANGLTASLTASYSNPSRFDATSIKIDHNLTKNISIFGRYNHAPSSGKVRTFSQVADTTSDTDTLTLGSTMIFGANLVNDLRGNWSRGTGAQNLYMDDFGGATPPSDSVLFPAGRSSADSFFFYTTTITTSIIRVGANAGNVQRQFNLVDTLSLTTGSHQLKFGVDWRKLRPTVSFSPLSFVAAGNSYANLTAGTTASASINVSGRNTLNINNYSFFAQDTWKANQKLTLTYGLRWEINPPPTSDTDIPLYPFQGVFDSNPIGLAPANTPMWKTQYGAFAPRFGIAYQITPKTVIRGGFGLFYDLGMPGTVASQVTITFPFARNKASSAVPFDINGAAYTPAPFSLVPTTPQAGLVAVDPNLKLPLTYQWNIAFEKQLGADNSVTISYVAAKGSDLIRRDTITPAAPVSATWNSISVLNNLDHSRYDSLQVEFQRRLSHGLQALVAYTLAKSTDSNSSDNGLLISNARTINDLNSSFNEGYSDFDVRHNFTAGFTYDLPFPKWNKVSNAILNNWSLQGIVRARSGMGMNPFASITLSNGLLQRLRLNRVDGVPLWLDDPTQPLNKRLNPAAFAIPQDGQPGNIQRNTLRNFGINQTDLALQRTFNLTERLKLDLRVEYFNVFNHPMFLFGLNTGMLYASSVNGPVNSSFGKITQTTNVGYATTGGGLSSQYQIGGPRSGQLTLKLRF